MSEVPKPPEPALERQSGASLLASISREMVKAMKTYYGRGPTKAKSYLMDDLLFIVMREGITQAEETMLSAGKGARFSPSAGSSKRSWPSGWSGRSSS